VWQCGCEGSILPKQRLELRRAQASPKATNSGGIAKVVRAHAYQRYPFTGRERRYKPARITNTNLTRPHKQLPSSLSSPYNPIIIGKYKMHSLNKKKRIVGVTQWYSTEQYKKELEFSECHPEK
jgi:hypothetical protein